MVAEHAGGGARAARHRGTRDLAAAGSGSKGLSRCATGGRGCFPDALPDHLRELPALRDRSACRPHAGRSGGPLLHGRPRGGRVGQGKPARTLGLRRGLGDRRPRRQSPGIELAPRSAGLRRPGRRGDRGDSRGLFWRCTGGELPGLCRQWDAGGATLRSHSRSDRRRRGCSARDPPPRLGAPRPGAGRAPASRRRSVSSRISSRGCRSGACEARNLAIAGALVAAAALHRRESRGAHFRSDFPESSEAWRFRQFLDSSRR